MGSKKGADAIGGHRELPAPVDSELPERAKHPAHEIAFQQGAIVAEGKMIGAADGHAQTRFRRQTLIDRLDVSENLPALGVGFARVVA